MSAKTGGLEYTIGIDSRNRNTTLYPEPNDFILEVASSQGRLPIQQLYLSSLEFPMSQYTIEDEWSNLYFDQGYPVEVTNNITAANQILSIMIGESTYTAVIPPRINPIVQVIPRSATSATFTTAFPHGLFNRELWNWGFPITLGGTFITDDAATNLTTNATVQIVNAMSFTISNIPLGTPATTWGPINTIVNGDIGFVWAPEIATPADLARIITHAFLEVLPSLPKVTVKYDSTINAFILSVTGLSAGVQAWLLSDGSPSLAFNLGIGCSLMHKLEPLKCISEGVSMITGAQPYCCLARVQYPTGNYIPDSFARTMEIIWNRLYFPAPCSPPPGSEATFIFSDSCGVCHTITIPFGWYSPDVLAAYLQTQMNVAVPTGNFTVTYSPTTGLFTFTSTGVFGLEFGDTDAVQRTAIALGFDNLPLRDLTSYSSATPVFIPTNACSGREVSDVLRVVADPSKKNFRFVLSGRKPQQATVVTLGGITTITFLQAHGYQVGDVIHIGPYLARVTAVVDWQTLEVDIGSINPADIAGAQCIVPYFSGIFNVYFGTLSDQTRYSIFPEILGFNPRPYFWTPGSYTLSPPYEWSFDGPNYILIQLENPTGSTYIQHAHHRDNIVNLLAKVVLYPPFSMQRLYPMQIMLQGINILNSIKVRILNPNHTLYRFHGRNWSATLSLVSPATTAQQVCY